MKKLIFTLAIVLGVATVSAQEVGQMWVGGQVGFLSSKTKGEKAGTAYSILPEFGYVVGENVGVGINVGYAHSKKGESKDHAFTVSPFVRYTFLKGDIGGLFVDGGVGYTTGKVTQYKNNSIKTNTFDVGFRPGVALDLSSRVALTAKFGFLGYQYEKEGKEKTNTFGFDFDLTNCLFGVNFIF